MPARIFIITGQTGAGKTTYAIDLAAKTGAIRFSIDDWMKALFWMDSPSPPDIDWSMARIARCEHQIQQQIRQLAERDISSVLDLGFTQAEHRNAFARFAGQIDCPAELHWIDIGKEERWRRVQQRNREKGVSFAMEVNEDMFAFMEGRWEAPCDKEMKWLEGKRIR